MVGRFRAVVVLMDEQVGCVSRMRYQMCHACIQIADMLQWMDVSVAWGMKFADVVGEVYLEALFCENGVLV